MNRLLISVSLLLFSALMSAANRLSLDQGVLVHLFEWKYSDIAIECKQFLKPKGFVGVVISPPNENLECPNRPWWERYQAVSYKLETRSGDRKQLEDMVKICNEAGIRVIADVVLNHMAGLFLAEPSKGTAGSPCNPSKYEFPDVGYTKDDFYDHCVVENYMNAKEVRTCALYNLYHLDQARDNVRKKTVTYLNDLLSIGIAGFRIDAAKHSKPEDLKAILEGTDKLSTSHGFPENTEPFVYLQVNDPGYEPITYHDYIELGLVTNYTYGKELGSHFGKSLRLSELEHFGMDGEVMAPDADKMIVFIDDYITQRDAGLGYNHLNYKESQPYKLAAAFMLAWPEGTPQISSSYSFNGYNDGPPHNNDSSILSPNLEKVDCSNKWICEHRWRQIYNMVHFHNTVKGTPIVKWWDDMNNQIAFGRGNKGFIVFNMNKDALKGTFQTCLPKGEYCDVISGNLVDGKCSTGKSITVDEKGMAEIEVLAYPRHDVHTDSVVAIHVEEAIISAEDKNDDPCAEETLQDVQTKVEPPVVQATLEGTSPSGDTQVEVQVTADNTKDTNLYEGDFKKKSITIKVDVLYFPKTDAIKYDLVEVIE